jgi:hypothetical protein
MCDLPISIEDKKVLVDNIKYLGPSYVDKMINKNNQDPNFIQLNECNNFIEQSIHHYTPPPPPPPMNQVNHLNQSQFVFFPHNQFAQPNGIIMQPNGMITQPNIGLMKNPHYQMEQNYQTNQIQPNIINVPINTHIQNQTPLPLAQNPFRMINNFEQKIGYVSNVLIPPGKKYNCYPPQESIGSTNVVFKSYQQKVSNEIIQIRDVDGTIKNKIVAVNEIVPVWILSNREKFIKWCEDNYIIY